MKYAILVFSFICLLEPVKAQPVLKDADIDQILKFVESYQGRKPVIMNFWATWCGPCKEEFPYIMKLKEKYPEDFGLIFVSADFEEAREEAAALAPRPSGESLSVSESASEHKEGSENPESKTQKIPASQRSSVVPKIPQIRVTSENLMNYGKFALALYDATANILIL